MYLKVHPIIIQWLQNNSSGLHKNKTQLFKAKMVSVLKKWDKVMYGLTGTQRWPHRVFTLTSHIYIPGHLLSAIGKFTSVSNLLQRFNLPERTMLHIQIYEVTHNLLHFRLLCTCSYCYKHQEPVHFISTHNIPYTTFYLCWQLDRKKTLEEQNIILTQLEIMKIHLIQEGKRLKE
jgi:hypothetical protein